MDSLLDLLNNTLLLMCTLSGPACISVVATNGSTRLSGGARVSAGGTSLVVCTSPVTSTVARLAGGSSGTIAAGNTLRGSGSVISTGGRVAASEFVFSLFSFVGGASSGTSTSARCSTSVMLLTGTLYTANRVLLVITLSTSKGASAAGTTGVVLEETLIVVVSALAETVGVGGEVFVRSGKLVGVSGGWENKVI